MQSSAILSLRMLELLHQAWNDPVWSKVIAGLIVPALLAILALGRRQRFREAIGVFLGHRRAPKPVITVINITAPPINPSPPTPLRYPLKCYVEMRNDSVSMIDVQVSNYHENAVPIKKLVLHVLQVRFNRWFPEPDGAERIAVLPKQLFQAWIGIDEATFTNSQIMKLRGKIGTLVLSVNGQQASIIL